MNSPSSKHYSRFARSRRGFTMMPLILFMFVIVGLVSAGMLLVGPRMQLGKTVEAKAGLEKGVDAIISWSVANGRLPADVEFSAILPYQNDPWTRPYVYTYDSTLANAATGGLCGTTFRSLLFPLLPAHLRDRQHYYRRIFFASSLLKS